MKKGKINLKEFKVTSFVTSIKEDQLDALKAGLDEATISALVGTCRGCPPTDDTEYL